MTLLDTLITCDLNTLEAAALLEKVKHADDLVCGIHPYDTDWRFELGSLRLDCRRLFERKFFEVNGG